MQRNLDEEGREPDGRNEPGAEPDLSRIDTGRPIDQKDDRSDRLGEHERNRYPTCAPDVFRVVGLELRPTDGDEQRIVNELHEPDQADQAKGGRHLYDEHRSQDVTFRVA